MEKVDSLDLIAEPTSSGLKDTSHYADLIPGRDVLFNASKDPQPEFVYETRVDFIDVNNFYGSDYFISKLPELPEDISSRLGDAYFDTTLVKQAILRETGKRWLDTAVKDDIQQMKNLLDNGLAAQGSLNLAFGIELTQAQIDALTTDIVWYVEEEYDGRTVLVPQVYLASATRATLTDRGAIMAAGESVYHRGHHRQRPERDQGRRRRYPRRYKRHHVEQRQDQRRRQCRDRLHHRRRQHHHASR